MISGRIAPVLAVAIFLEGCASVVDGSTQPIQLSTAPASGASCTLSNARGGWSVVTPGIVVVKRSESLLRVHCTKTGWQEASDYIASRIPTDAAVAMALPYVGILETAVDASTGAASQYPGTYVVHMKEAVPTPAPAASDPAQSEKPQAAQISSQ